MMNANKLTAFLAGIIISMGAMYIERSEIHFAWIAVFVLPGVFIFVIGIQPLRAWATGDRTSPVWPDSSEDWQVMKSTWARMFICFLGAIVAGIIDFALTS